MIAITYSEQCAINKYYELHKGVEEVLGDKLKEDFALAVQVALVQSTTQELQRMLDSRGEGYNESE